MRSRPPARTAHRWSCHHARSPAADLGDLRFAVGLRGYRMDEVDIILDGWPTSSRAGRAHRGLDRAANRSWRRFSSKASSTMAELV